MKTGYGDGLNDQPVKHYGGGSFSKKDLEEVAKERAAIKAEMKKLEEARLRRTSRYCNR